MNIYMQLWLAITPMSLSSQLYEYFHSNLAICLYLNFFLITTSYIFLLPLTNSNKFFSLCLRNLTPKLMLKQTELSISEVRPFLVVPIYFSCWILWFPIIDRKNLWIIFWMKCCEQYVWLASEFIFILVFDGGI